MHSMQKYTRNILNIPLVCKSHKNMQQIFQIYAEYGLCNTSNDSVILFRQQNKRYHHRGSSVTSISSGDESTKGTSMGCFKFQ